MGDARCLVARDRGCWGGFRCREAALPRDFLHDPAIHIGESIGEKGGALGADQDNRVVPHGMQDSLSPQRGFNRDGAIGNADGQWEVSSGLSGEDSSCDFGSGGDPDQTCDGGGLRVIQECEGFGERAFTLNNKQALWVNAESSLGLL